MTTGEVKPNKYNDANLSKCSPFSKLNAAREQESGCRSHIAGSVI